MYLLVFIVNLLCVRFKLYFIKLYFLIIKFCYKDFVNYGNIYREGRNKYYIFICWRGVVVCRYLCFFGFLFYVGEGDFVVLSLVVGVSRVTSDWVVYFDLVVIGFVSFSEFGFMSIG